MLNVADRKLERILYWEYAQIVRYYIYGCETSPFDYSKIFGKNLHFLRLSSGFAVNESAHLLGVSIEKLRQYEAEYGKY